MDLISFGHSNLRKVSKKIYFPLNENISTFINKITAEISKNGWAGLSAPQYGKNINLFAFEIRENRVKKNEISVPLTVAINPDILWQCKTQSQGWERCLSYPEIEGLVNRSQEIGYSYSSLTGNTVEGRARGFFARVFQHEMDHLRGIVFPERMGLDSPFRCFRTKTLLNPYDIWKSLSRLNIYPSPSSLFL